MYFTITTRFFWTKEVFMINIYEKRMLNCEVSMETIMESNKNIELAEKML